MSHILITGGNGGLGRELVARLNPDRHTVRIMSRGMRPTKLDARIEWAQADLRTGSGIAEAVRGVDVVYHLATGQSHSPNDVRLVDVEGTHRLLELSREEGVKNFIYSSIIGVEHFPGFFYYKAKFDAERIIESSGVPYTILRAAQLHSLIDMVLKAANHLPFILLPTTLQMQSVDTGEVAAQLAPLAHESALKRVPEVAGPEVLLSGEMARIWLKLRGIRKPIINLPLPGATMDAFRRGLNTAPQQTVGKITWAEWVARAYSIAPTKPVTAKALLRETES
jgi:uncharacterized protein YbjT (DUF2867 family)